MKFPSRGLIAALAIAALISTPTAAHAEKHTMDDATGDVLKFTIDSSVGVAAPEYTSVDITRSVVRHSARQVKIKVRIVDIQPGAALPDLGVGIRTGRTSYSLSLFRDTGYALATERGKAVKCPDKSQSISAEDDLILISVPRACLGSPRWVKVGISASNYVAPGGFVYDAQPRGGSRLAYGPKLTRG